MQKQQQQNAIQEAAYYAWERDGRPCGNEWYFWLKAEQEYLQHEIDRQSDVEDAIQETSEESFPASDAPSWNTSHV